MLDRLDVEQTYTRAELGVLEEWARCVFPRDPTSWCLLFITLHGMHGYVNHWDGSRLVMEGRDADRDVNRWLLGSTDAGCRVGLMFRNAEGERFTYKGELRLVRGEPAPAYFEWELAA